MSENISHEISYENAHPNAQKLMKEPFFYSITDSSAPFGSDDGWETFQELHRWLPSNKNADKIDFIHQQLSYWGYPYFNLRSLDITEILSYINSSQIGDRFLIGIDDAIIATAFGQLYIEGFIDLNLRSLASIALKRQLLPEIINVYREHSEIRKMNLEVLLKIINP